MDLNRPWKFDEQVANEFDVHARQSIPAYEQVIRLCLQAVKTTCSPADRIAEVGCATGFTLRQLEAAGFTSLVGVDSSKAMLEKCVHKHAKLVCSEQFPVEDGPFKAVLINWTLHFVPPAQRAAYLADIRRSLALGSILLLTEKTLQSPFVESLYHAFKREQGLSDAEIMAKKKSLEGVLQPLPHTWYVETLGNLGFTTQILWAQWGFITYLASID